MLKYEIVSILRNKAAYIFLLVVLLFGLKATVELQRSITSSQDTNYIKRELQYELVMHRQLLESELATARRDAGDAKRRKFNTNAIQFRKWRIEELQELIALLEVGGTESQQFQKEYKAYGVICSIVSYQMFVYPERGCSPVEVRCADMFQKWGRQLGLYDLPFDISSMTANPYVSSELMEASVAAYENNMGRLEHLLNDYDKKSLGLDSGSPYAFLETLFCENAYVLTILDICILLFSFGYIMEGKNDHRYEFMTVQPYSEWKKYRHYVTSFFGAAGVVCAIGIGVWFLYWGMRCGFDGIDSHMFVDVKTYKRFYSYEHLEDYSYEGLARMYADYKYTDGGRGVMLYTTYPLGSLPLYRFLLYMCILAALKVLFFAMLGSGIRVLIQHSQGGIAVVAAATVLTGYSQLTGWGKPYNPFAIGSCWNVTLGSERITWLYAVLELTFSCILIMIITCTVSGKKDRI